MSFTNARNFTIHGSTFSNVAGDQIVTNVTHIHQYRVAQVAHANMPRGSRGDVDVDNDEYTLPMPTTPPYCTFLSTIADIQHALAPVNDIMSDNRLFSILLADLERLRHSAAFAGAIVEFLDNVCPKFMLVSAKKHVERYHVVLRDFHRDIIRIRQGLRSSLIEPFWWRILRAATTPNIHKLISAMISEIDGFQKPILQFLAVYKEYFMTINFLDWEPEKKRSAWSKFQAAHNSSLGSLKDVALDFVTVLNIDNTTLSVPTLWCSSWEDLHKLYLVINWQITKDRSQSLVFSKVVLFNVGPDSSHISQLTNGSALKLALLINHPVVFFEDNINICPNCRKLLPSREQSRMSLFQCLHCGFEYSVQRFGGSRETNRIFGILGSCYSEIDRTNAYRVKDPIPRSRSPSCFTHVESWSQIAAAQVILDIRGNPDHVLDLIQNLAQRESPLRGCAVHLVHEDLKFTWPINIIVPDQESGSAWLNNPRTFTAGRIELPNLTIFGVSSPSGRHEDLNHLLDSLSLPSLQYFEVEIDLFLLLHPQDIIPSVFESIRSFLSLTRALRRLHITIVPYYHHHFVSSTLESFLISVLPQLTAIEQLDITTRPQEMLPIPIIDTCTLHHYNKSIRHPDTDLLTATSEKVRREYPEPWAVSYVTEIDPDATYYIHVRHTADLFFDKLPDDFSFADDSYDFFEEFLLSNPFPSTEPDLCDDPRESVHGGPVKTNLTTGDENGASVAAVYVPSMDTDSDDSCSLEEYESCEEFDGDGADED
ncbi:hypothetical protein HGRIS_007049 [Hohenbuehelia grisea]|uniref:Uncharacterized protein n=1 Tax=Hohenbuehelia grisea TaxID=104357 RepID=A0ABR3JB01_9AGAR